jgi:Uma2 family endonuclease
MSSQLNAHISPEEYLGIERKSEIRSEYLNGEMFAMVGASREHNLIVANLTREITQQLKGKPCELYPTDMRVRIPATGLYTYPNVVVVCGEPLFEDEHVDTLLNPTLIIEVLSESTESYDRGKKFSHYQTVSALVEYLLVAQDEYRIEQFVKQPDGHWLYSDARSPEGSLELASIQCVLALKEVYDRVALP